MDVVRTPAERFSDLPGYPYPPCYVEVGPKSAGPLRMHYVEAGPPDADPVLLLHGQPTWSYLYRTVIETVAAAGHWVLAPDLIGFGRSDKPTDRFDYTFQRHIDWLARFVVALDLRRITLVVQDWGGPIGLAVLAAEPDRFARVVATNTILHTSEPALAGRLGWANHAGEEGRVVLQEALVDYISFTQRAPVLRASDFVSFATGGAVAPDVLTAYDAPFPDETYQAGMRQFPSLIPLTGNDPGAAINRATWTALGDFTRSFLTAYSDGDEASAGWDAIFQERVPGARGQPHTIIEGAGHFVQEDKGKELGEIITRFIDTDRTGDAEAADHSSDGCRTAPRSPDLVGSRPLSKKEGRTMDWQAWARRMEETDGADTFEALFARGGVFSDPVTPWTTDVRKVANDTDSIFPDWQQRIDTIRGGDDWAVFEWTGTATFYPEGPDRPGIPIKMEGATVIEIDAEGRVTRWRDYLDTNEPTQQIQKGMAAAGLDPAGAPQPD